MAPELELFIEKEVASGRFPDRETFIAYAVRLVQLERGATIAGIQAGLDDVEAGRMMSVQEAFADIRRAANLPSVP